MKLCSIVPKKGGMQFFPCYGSFPPCNRGAANLSRDTFTRHMFRLYEVKMEKKLDNNFEIEK